MTISPELFMAILSMDSYNRGYNPGISDGEHVENDVDLGLGDAVDTLVGNARIISRVSSDPDGEAQAAGFYAVAYDWNGETVISYRGTDNPNPLAAGSDFWNGWTLGAGFPQASQGAEQDKRSDVVPLGSIPRSLQTFRRAEGSRNRSSEATTS